MTDIVERLRDMRLLERRDIAGEAADEIERLRAEVDRIRAGGCARDQRTTQYCAEAEALRADAERYRWLRVQDDRDWNDLFRDSHEGLDAAIDDARAAK